MPGSAYDEIAEWYDGVIGAGLPLGGAPLLALAGEVEVQRAHGTVVREDYLTSRPCPRRRAPG
jgi:hypothetical protein